MKLLVGESVLLYVFEEMLRDRCFCWMIARGTTKSSSKVIMSSPRYLKGLLLDLVGWILLLL